MFNFLKIEGVWFWKIWRDTVKTAFAKDRYKLSEVFIVDGHKVKFNRLITRFKKQAFLIDDTTFWVEHCENDETKSPVTNDNGEFVCNIEDLFVNIYKGLIPGI